MQVIKQFEQYSYGDDPACGMRRDGDGMYGDRVRYMVCG